VRPLDNYVIALAATVHKRGVPLDADGWPIVPTRDACGLCGLRFRIADDDPHWSAGHGPICPEPEVP
jgi:hypothetical protein